ncbi:helix-turn-helix domain-containing protein [Luteimonas qiangzhengi]|uniref:helix-turn-helix domain-containing protein n=1 Tax=Luteimonas sp. MJ146 TaxID=3129240 RepID=UPI0031B9BA4B
MSSAANAGVSQQGSGLRLRQAREAAGLGIAEVAAQMHVPVRVVSSLEEGRWEHLGAAVFVRGQLRSYARIVGLSEADLLVADELPPVTPPALQPRTFTPRYRRIAEQAARRMVYVVITATLVVPVWMVTRGHMEGSPAEVASLDLARSPVAEGQGATALNNPTQRQQRPLTASMTPIQTRRTQPSAAVEAGASGAPALALRFKEDSWVEISGRDGRQLEQALLRAGEERSYAAGEVSRIVLGNAGAVEVIRFGDIQDIQPFQRANVARFTVSSDGSLAPLAD